MSHSFAAEDKANPGDDIFYTANALYNKGLYEVALKEYREFLSKYGKHPKKDQGRLGIALCLYSLGRYEEAANEFRALLKSDQVAAKSQLRLLLAQCQLKNGKYGEAEDLFKDIAANGPKAYAPKANTGLIDAFYHQKKWADVAEKSEQAINSGLDQSGMLRVAFQSGMSLYNLDKYAKASKMFSRVVEELDKASPLRNRAVFLLAECLRETGENDKALEHYKQIAGLKESELKPEALYRMGLLYFKAGKFAEAAKQLDQFTREHGDHQLAEKAKLYMARAHLEQGSAKKAEVILAPLANAQQPMPEAVLWLGRIYLRNEDYAKAESVLGKNPGKVSDESLAADLMYSHASALMGLEKYKEAAAKFGQTVAKHPDWQYLPECLMRQAYCLHYAGDYRASQKLCADFLRKFPKSKDASDVAFLNGENLYLLEKPEEALAAYRDFIAHNREHTDIDKARLRIANILYDKEDWQGALKVLDSMSKDKLDSEFFNQTSFLAGDIFFEKGDWKSARDNLLKFVKEQPEAPNLDVALFKLAMACEETGESAQAIDHFKTMVSKCGDSENMPGALVNLGRLLCEKENYADARQYLQQMVSKHGNHALRDKADYYLGWAWLQEDKPDEARRHFDHIVAEFPDSNLAADALFHLGTIDMEKGNFDEAAKMFGNLTQRHSDFDLLDQALFQRGVALIKTEQWQPAAECFKKLSGQFPESRLSASAIYNRARCLNALGDRTAALGLYERVLEKHPKSKVFSKAALNLSELLYEQQKYAEALKHIDRGIEKAGEDDILSKLLYRRGWCHFDLGDHKKAAEDFEKLASQFPESDFAAEAEFQAGEARFKIGENTAAREHFAAAVQKAGDNSELGELSLLRLGETQALTKQWPQSKQTYETFINRYGKSEWINRARLGLGWAFENSRQFDQAIKAYRQVTESGGKTETAARAQFQIGECEFARKDYEDAIREFVKVAVKYNSGKWGSKASLELGRVFESRDDLEKAKNQYRETIEKYENEEAAVAAEARLQALE